MMLKKILLIGCIAIVCMGCGKSQLPVSLILDTDLAPDYDDVGALAVLHALADSGEVNILGIVASNRCEATIPCIEIINRHFGHPNIPLGAVKGEAPYLDAQFPGQKWTEVLPARYEHKLENTSAATDAVNLYRKLLSAAPDSSVTIVTIGFLTNLKNLLQSPADEYSPLVGKELVKTKVKQLVSMAGFFPEGREYNVYCDVVSSQYVVEYWPTPILFSGFEIGVDILTGCRLVEKGSPDSPVREAYALSLPQGNPQGRNSWDQTAVLVGVRGVRDYFDIERGVMTVTSDSVNHWEPSKIGQHARLLKKMDVKSITKVIENLMMHEP